MTDAREIISNAIAQARNMDHPNWTSFILQRLTAAGYRILGPGEQAVTEAMVEAAVQAVRQYTRDTLFIDEHRELVRDALKAAQEQGR